MDKTLEVDLSSEIYSKQFTTEHHNIFVSSDSVSEFLDDRLLDYKVSGDFFDILQSLYGSFVVSREYEHFVVGLDYTNNHYWQSALQVPHPSGLFFDPSTQRLYVSSTRTPNIITSYKFADDNLFENNILPRGLLKPSGTLMLPEKSRYFPGSFYIHDLVLFDGDLHATITGHNFFGKVPFDKDWENVWSPKILGKAGDLKFRQNFLQLNSVAIGNQGIGSSYFTGFSELTTGPKPWKDGYGPLEKGVVFSGDSGEVICRDLTCPHSAKINGDKLWLCNSGFGEVGYLDTPLYKKADSMKFIPIATLPGFVRGMTIVGDYIFVGLSKVIEKYEPYAPGVDPKNSKCGIWIINKHSGQTLGSLDWVNGYQVYDVQFLPGIAQPEFPNGTIKQDGINHFLRFLG